MRNTRISSLLALALPFSLLAAEEHHLMGCARLDQPLVGARVIVKALDGSILAEAAEATGPLGGFSLSLPRALPAGFRVEVQNGNLNGQAFDGVLSARVEGHRAHEGVPVTFQSTLQARYAERQGCGAAAAGMACFTAIEASNPTLAKAWRASGQGFDLYTENLVNQVRWNQPVALSEKDGFVVGWIFKFAATEILKGAGGKAFEEGLGWVLHLLGGQDPYEKIEGKLNEMNQKLDKIYNEILGFEVRMESILQEMRLEAEYNAMIQNLANVSSMYDKRLVVLPTLKDRDFARSEAARLDGDIATMTLRDLEVIREKMTAPVIGKPFYWHLSEHMAHQVMAGTLTIDQAFDRYEKTFCFLTGHQLKGIALLSEHAHTSKSPEDIKNLVNRAMKDHLESLRVQTEAYQDGAEKLLVLFAKADCTWERNAIGRGANGRFYPRVDSAVGGSLNLDNLNVVRLTYDRNAPKHVEIKGLDRLYDRLTTEGPALELVGNGQRAHARQERGHLNPVTWEFKKEGRTVNYAIRRYGFENLPAGSWELSNALPEYTVDAASLAKLSPKACGASLLPFSFPVPVGRDGAFSSLPLHAFAPKCMFTEDGDHRDGSLIRGEQDLFLRSHNKGYAWTQPIIFNGQLLGWNLRPDGGKTEAFAFRNLGSPLRCGEPFQFLRNGRITVDGDGKLYPKLSFYNNSENTYTVFDNKTPSVVSALADLSGFPVSYGDWIRIRSHHNGRLVREMDGYGLKADGEGNCEGTWLWWRLEK